MIMHIDYKYKYIFIIIIKKKKNPKCKIPLCSTIKAEKY